MSNITDHLKSMRRQVNSLLHYMKCDIYERKEVEDTENGTTIEKYVQTKSDIPCRIEWKQATRGGIQEKEPFSEIHKLGFLYTSNLIIPSGSIIEVYIMENGAKKVIGSFHSTSPSLYYTSHTVTPIELYQRYG